ncbi:MAG: hypothetical protein P9E24_05045 [Candidatus Competibacter sp.]|nr:hypothetical protein [Candidatus Competibacter sp.]MDG4584304.1 hypothetical protein [Candidatus Competibacter sp.]
MVALEQHRGGGRFIYLTTYQNETVEAALARLGYSPRHAESVVFIYWESEIRVHEHA